MKRCTLIPLLFFLFSLSCAGVLYFHCMCRGLYWRDTAEFILAAKALGIPHSPGHPFLPLCAKSIVVVLFWMQDQAAIHFFSLLAGLGAGFLLYFGIYKSREATRETLTSSISALLATTGLFLAKDYFDYATISEVYIPFTFFSGILFLGGNFILKEIPEHRFQKTRSYIFLIFCLGLGLTNHVALLSMIPGLLFILLKLVKGSRQNSMRLKIILCTIFFGILGLSPYLYLPLRAKFQPVLNWGDPQNFGNFLWVMFSGGFAGDIIKLLFSETGNALKILTQYFKDNIFLPMLFFSILGFVRYSRKYPLAAVSTGTTLILIIVIALVVGGGFDIKGYLLPVLFILFYYSGLGIVFVADHIKSRKRHGTIYLAILFNLLLSGILFHAGNNLKAKDTSADAYAKWLCNSLPGRSLLITDNTHDYFLVKAWNYLHGIKNEVFYIPVLIYPWAIKEFELSLSRQGIKFPMSEKFSPDDLMKTMISISASGISTFYSPFQNFLVNPQYLIPKGPVYEVNKNNFFESPIPSYPEEFKKLNDPYFQKRMGLVYSLLGTYFDRTGSNKKAIEALKISQNFMPENYYVNMNMGKLLIKDGDSDEAMKMFERASELCGKSVYPMLWMALTLSQKGNDAGALKILEKAQKRNDQNAEIYYFQGILKWKNRDLVAASKLFRKVLNINSDHVRAMNALAVICIGMKEYSKAEQELNRVLAAKKSSMETDYNFLALYRLQKNMEKVREFEQKIKIGGHPVPKEEDVDGLMPPPVFELDYTEYSEQ